MRSEEVLQTVSVLCSAFLLANCEYISHLMTSPQHAVLEIGSNFTATCTLINTTEATADDLYWKLGNAIVPPERYTKINSTSVNVTVTVSERSNEILYCHCRNVSLYVRLHHDHFYHGIVLVKGYRPEKPLNLSCTALQEQTFISPTLSCEWVALRRQTTQVPTNYTLYVKIILSNETFNQTSDKIKNEAQVTMGTFHNHSPLDIWVEVRNKLGRIESAHLRGDSNAFVKTNPPSHVNAISEKAFPYSLLINWVRPIHRLYLELVYQIRFSPRSTDLWTYVPRDDTSINIESFRLQNLQPDTEYVIQVRCKYYKENQGHWSNWSANATQRTPENRPASKPDVWVNVTESAKGRDLQFACKDPVLANGRIRWINMRVGSRGSNGSMQWESFSFNRSEEEITVLHKVFLPLHKSLIVYFTAVNSVGESPEASLVVSARAHESVQELQVHPVEGKLSVEWKPPNSTNVSEYVLEWSSATGMDWQRVSRTTRSAVIKGNLQPFVCYKVSIYPLYSGRIGQAASTDAYVEQGAPLEAPDVSLLGYPGRNEATLVWDQVPISSRRGFITHYRLFYGPPITEVMLPANSTSYTLKSLMPNTKYEVWIQASTIAGSKNSSKIFFSTQKYAPGQIESIAVGISVCFLFGILFLMLICFCKKDKLKQKFWPQIPDPGESTIRSWSPDYNLKAELPKESCLSGISVLEVDTSRCVSEEDKSSPSMKKDKFLSEEHSSGIGGSSCMSSPRHSVSDSDESADMADSTAGTVQYSSVVASAGYKGQTPHPQPQAPASFSRSESTQPLLDSEENQDSDRAPRSVLQSSEEEEEEEEQTGSYMPQRGGYRPQ
ncbi:interleukin-6 receptor subunit beta isoform X1 [Gouania willdenowi]|uniref:interleukin-6 receptor subunit beta isoform X1 n=1 Tax=Gouania willdenowi TaxID=441366 RepID=UPI0010559C35|nr:interleukin-6 receptor subunit beta-like isoform X1 [Gouania willdenowi]